MTQLCGCCRLLHQPVRDIASIGPCVSHRFPLADFTRLKLVKAKKIVQQADEASRKAKEGEACHKENDEDITAAYDATDDADVVF